MPRYARRSPVQRVPIFEQRLAELQKQQGVTDKVLAARLNVDASCPHHWRSGYARPNLDRLLQLATIFNVSPNYLLGWEPQEQALTVFRRRGEQVDALQRFASDYPEAIGPRRDRHGNKKVRAVSS